MSTEWQLKAKIALYNALVNAWRRRESGVIYGRKL